MSVVEKYLVLHQKGEEKMCVELMMSDWRGGGSVGDMAEDLGI